MLISRSNVRETAYLGDPALTIHIYRAYEVSSCGQPKFDIDLHIFEKVLHDYAQAICPEITLLQ